MKEKSKIVLQLKCLGHIPSFKNKKRAILDRRTGKMRTMTDAKTQKWMHHCIASFASQLRSQCLTTEGGTSTESLQRYLTAFVPPDDCWQVIPEIRIVAERGKAADAIIEIEVL